MALDLGTLVAKVKVDDDDFDKKTDGWSKKGAGVASAFGNVAADAISQATSMLGEFVGEAMTASDATQKFAKTLEFAGLDTSKIDGLKKSTQEYADQTVYSLTDIQSITAQLASNGVEGYDTLAMSLGNLNAIAGGNAETFGRVGSVVTQTAGAGKLITENWNQLAEAIPGASGKLQDALLQAGAYTGDFRDAMSEGQITAEEFNAAIQLVGTDPIAVEAAKSVETFEGAQGNAAAALQSQLVKALDTVKPAITGLINGVADFITNIEEWTPVLAGLGAALLVALAPAIWGAVTATWAFTGALLANPITWVVLAIGALVAGIVWLIMNWDTAVAWISEVWGGFIGWITGVIEGFVGWWNGIWTEVGNFFKDLWDGFVSFVKVLWENSFVGWLVNTLVMILSNWDAIWSAVGETIRSIWDGFVGFVTGVWEGFIGWIKGVLNGFVGFWKGIWESVSNGVRDIWGGIISWFESVPQKIKDVFMGAATWLYNIGRDIVNGLWDGLKSIWESVSGWFEDTFGGIIDTVAGIFGIASPSRVMREMGIFVGQGFVEGLERMGDPIDRELSDMLAVPPVTVVSDTDADAAAARGGAKVVNYYAAENQSLSDEEALYAALGSPRVKD